MLDACAISLGEKFTISCGGRQKPARPESKGAYVSKARGISNYTNRISRGSPPWLGGPVFIHCDPKAARGARFLFAMYKAANVSPLGDRFRRGEFNNELTL